MALTLRYGRIKRGTLQKFRPSNQFWPPKTKRTGPETRADALGEALFYFFIFGCRSS
jgi:hypothetical protein